MGHIFLIVLVILLATLAGVSVALTFSHLAQEIRSSRFLRSLLIVWISLLCGILLILAFLVFRFDGDWRSTPTQTVSDYEAELIY